MKRISRSTAVLAAIFVVGLSLLLYPSVSDYWNSFHQSRAIASLMETVSHMDAGRYNALLQEARVYNEILRDSETRLSMSEEEKEKYCTQLGSVGGAVGYLEIPAIKVSLPVYLGTKESILQAGVGVLEGSSLPVGGKGTHAVLTGHRGLPSATLFTHLDRLTEGDLFHTHVLNETATYEVDRILIVEPTEVDALRIDAEKDYCTLVTCTPYGVNSHRMLVRGHRVESPEDLRFLRISADAVQVEPMVMAPLMAAPMLALLMAGALRSNGRTGTMTMPKKGGKSDEKT